MPHRRSPSATASTSPSATHTVRCPPAPRTDPTRSPEIGAPCTPASAGAAAGRSGTPAGDPGAALPLSSAVAIDRVVAARVDAPEAGQRNLVERVIADIDDRLLEDGGAKRVHRYAVAGDPVGEGVHARL